MYLASLISNKDEKFRNFKKGLLPALIVVGFVCFLIMLQPDFGSCMIVFMCSAIVILVGGSNLKHIFLLGTCLLAVIGAMGIALYLLKSGDKELTIVSTVYYVSGPLVDINWTMGYQIVQSLYAFGHGGFAGAGFGQGIQKLHYLPEAHNDFIFAIIGEELGFIGSALFMLVYLVLHLAGNSYCCSVSGYFGMLAGVGIMGCWLSSRY